MTKSSRVLVVDDDGFIRGLIADALGGVYRVVAVADAETALETIRNERFDAILLDVELPGIDGYEACRRLKQNSAMADIPVIFISSRDRIADRLKGYEAGGEDYIVKPFSPEELKAKLARLLVWSAEYLRLRDNADYANRTAMTAMTSMGELGALLQALKKFNVCADYAALAGAVLEGLSFYGLHGAAQLRFPGGALTQAWHGTATPLEASVISRMADMDRVVQFKTRMSITYERVSILINDMPVEDAERCGRLRDHLTMLAESADMRVQALSTGSESERRGRTIAYAIKEMTRALQDIDHAQREAHVATGIAAEAMTTRLDRAYVQAGLSEQQEDLLTRTVQEGIDSVLAVQAAGIGAQDRLTAAIAEMKAALG